MNSQIDPAKFSVRIIEAGDKEYLQAALNMMTNESRRLRFFSSVKKLTEKELEFFTEVDQRNHLAFVGIYDDKYPAGSIRCVRNLERPEYAELAITIIDEFHHYGLGCQMLDILAASAIKEKITHLYGDFHTSNVNMLKLLEKYRFRHNIPSDSFLLDRKADGFLYFEMALA